MKAAVYFHYDEHDVLLYVGSSADPVSRASGHAYASAWVQYAARGTATWYPTLDAAREAEENAIRMLHPVFNFKYAEVGRRARIEKYFLNRGLTLSVAESKKPGGSPLVTLTQAATALMLSHRGLRSDRDRRPDFPAPAVRATRNGQPNLYRFDDIASWVAIHRARTARRAVA